MSNPKELSVATPRPLPVILLADVSGTMSVDGKIQALNQAVREMLDAFGGEADPRAEIHAAVITFGRNGALLHLPLTPASQASWVDLPADGGTPMGAAFTLVTQLLQDRQVIPSRAYRPTLILVSDGQPTDEWREPLTALLGSERGGKAQRLAMAIGADADESVLKEFLAEPGARVFHAGEARQIRHFFRWVTMSVTHRSRSANPNVAPPAVDEGWDL